MAHTWYILIGLDWVGVSTELFDPNRSWYILIGLDWGGVRREWFEIVSTELFDPNRSGLFCRFKEDDPQALVIS